MIQMKNMRFVGVLVLTFFFFLSSAYADQLSNQLSETKGPLHKFSRGIVYMIGSPFQVFKDVIQISAETEPFYLATWKGPTVGLATGVYDTGRQLFAGLFDLFTFYTPAGRDWKPLCAPETMIPEV
ncbi:MAG: hypothetical protein A3G33_01990 [Omnitrophica bacterium RIFCSPLOWO2_12_FULL_44_17]|uniref:Exosortase system-associated protein, TIGR04073 family n=1 Tax=Candidatus Danuiimicrobium aquiferis TaxID=1801832 RepID=A0A1G1KT50_9BACT|nr:MAG: hypothetical protein A3B72_04100 [Omnitrophica bacterium RIFCSPHIGHO2_02_FULL_45_28]OGW91508.1 MAG: hypothetical protein A3E74_05335 [Omnitrophica bacterium RIFCSPHIGHO2_12_FULL_44_12]OGW96108.1 MAG: hypothetical protein A3G33_01990 [Omnitrophica bacterium RIFCSPLOWO2_12_FULL_44_17]OGX04657.1 MAG: hypothetical protein A3J12_11460 [Omnitrophica bacterium RIFCSPLOWO2_02_FULL_44_11]